MLNKYCCFEIPSLIWIILTLNSGLSTIKISVQISPYKINYAIDGKVMRKSIDMNVHSKFELTKIEGLTS
jgi:hypothetical protein